MEWITDGCGGMLDKFEGEFTSPGYPGYYPPSTVCEWKITSEHGNTIEIVIEDFSFETSKTCQYDYLAVGIFIPNSSSLTVIFILDLQWR